MGKKIKTTVVGSYPKPKYIMGNISGRDLLDTSGNLFHQIEKEIKKLHKQFDVFEYQTFGFLGCFGVNELQRTVLGQIDQMLFSNVLPQNMNYILAGVAIKGKNV